jgi:putative chitinase
MTKEQYYKIVKRNINSQDELIYSTLIPMFETYSINSIYEITHYMSQMNIESRYFSVFEENLNYSSKRLLEVFPKYFKPSNVALYANKPQKIANRVYANRYGNGDENSGDGWKYRGRSPIQITFKSNYRDCGKDLQIDLVNNPDFAITIQCGITISGWFWNKNGINKIISFSPESVSKVTLVINGGSNGLDEREKEFDRIKNILM